MPKFIQRLLRREPSVSEAARILGSRARKPNPDPGNMQALRREMGMPEWRRSA